MPRKFFVNATGPVAKVDGGAAVTMPADAIVDLVGGPFPYSGDLVEIEWQGQRGMMPTSWLGEELVELNEFAAHAQRCLDELVPGLGIEVNGIRDYDSAHKPQEIKEDFSLDGDPDEICRRLRALLAQLPSGITMSRPKPLPPDMPTIAKVQEISHEDVLVRCEFKYDARHQGNVAWLKCWYYSA